jgi:hypothetical protein
VGEPISVSEVDNIAFESFGVRVLVASDAPEVFERMLDLLPPDAEPCPPTDVEASFAILSDGNGTYRFERDDSPVSKDIDLPFALALIEGQLRIFVGLHAPGMIFVHAGVVTYNDRAIVVPGLSFSGKTTLVLALVRAGATYFSDEFAVIDQAGLVHPFTKPLSIRDHAQVQRDHHVEHLGGIAGVDPAPIGVVLFTEYRSGAPWEPTPLSAGRAVLTMLENTLPARQRTEEALRVLKRVVDGAVVLEGERGEAQEIAVRLLDIVSS